MSAENTLIHLGAGGLGGTAGAVATCPLEVVKTRLQSSVAHFTPTPVETKKSKLPLSQTQRKLYSTFPPSSLRSTTVSVPPLRTSPSLWSCIRFIVQHEGYRGLFKGLGPNLVGVFPSRAIYFCAYAQSKTFFNQLDAVFNPETPQVHMCSAAVAGFTASTSTNPIWYIKTRLQLDQKRSHSLTVWKCIRDTYSSLGIRGFYRGITASYYGIAETAIHFVIYEGIKAKLRERKRENGLDESRQSSVDFLEFMCAGAVSKSTATILAYPHEVARTRLRQEGNVYIRFWQTLGLVFKEEGVAGLYRGLATQLVRQIPNTAIMMATYELVVYAGTRYLEKSDDEEGDAHY